MQAQKIPHAMGTRPSHRQLLIGNLADRTSVNVETIRYYERVGLIPAPPRTRGRHRTYDESHVQRLTFIRRSRELGFSLADIQTLLELAHGENPACGRAKDVALRHLGDVRGKIASLRKLERALGELTAACMPGRQRCCPIIGALSGATAATGRRARK